MDVGNVQFSSLACRILPNNSQNHRKIIASVSAVTSSLSIIGAGSIIVYAIAKKVVRNPEVRPLFHLALADCLLAVLWLSGVIIEFRNSHWQCFYLDAVAEMIHLASFFLTVNYGLNVYFRLKEKTCNINDLQFSTVSSNGFYTWFFRVCYVLSWLLPVVVMFPLILKGDPKPSCSMCLLLFDRPRSNEFDTKHIWFYYGSLVILSSLVLSIVALLVLYFLTRRLYRRTIIQSAFVMRCCISALRKLSNTKSVCHTQYIFSGVLTDRERASIDEMQQRILLYILVFFVCWSPAFVVAATDLDRDPHQMDWKHYSALFVLQGLTAPMQGFLNCIVYGWTRKGFRQATERRSLLGSTSSSRRSSYEAMDGLSL